MHKMFLEVDDSNLWGCVTTRRFLSLKGLFGLLTMNLELEAV